MIGDPWRRELVRVAVGVVALAVPGALLGHPAAFVLAGALGWSGWHAVQAYRLAAWLREGKRGQRPVARGVWREIYADLDALQRKNRKKKKRLATVIRRFTEVASAIPDATVLLEGTDVIAWMNPAAQRLLGLKMPLDLGQPLANLLRVPVLSEYLESGEFDNPLEMDAPGGTGVRLLLRLVPYGEKRRLLVARDITRLTRLEQMRRDFVANVSHELRTPLTVIHGYLEGMADDAASTPEQWRRPVEVMCEQSVRMQRIVEELLQLSRLENSSAGPPLVPVHVGSLLRSIRTEASSVSRNRHEILLEIDETLDLLGDRAELHSAFSNIVLNAVRYTPERGSIEIRFERDANGGAWLGVCDTGLGIEAHHIERLTERFYRVDRARSRASGGTGLGLAIAKHVLARHDARLEVTSALGEGSTFGCRFGVERVYEPVVEPGVTNA